LINTLRKREVGDEIQIKILRDKKPISLKAKLKARP